MKLGIDFNQFTYPGLRRSFRQVGFSQILDRVALAELEQRSGPTRALLTLARAVPPIKHLILTFSRATVFVCIK